MKLKVIYKNKKYDDTFFRNVKDDDSNEILDWWLHKDNEPTYISEPLQFKFIRDDIFNIEVNKLTNYNFKNPNGVIN